MKLAINWVYEVNHFVAVHTFDRKVMWLQEGETFTVLARHKVRTSNPSAAVFWHIVLCGSFGVVTIKDSWRDDDRVKTVR